MDSQRRWNRQTRNIETSQHIVGFLDILGFKNLLEAKDFDLLLALFEEITDTVYQYKRRSFLSAWDDVFNPRVTNFSDSIIIYQPIYEKQGKWSHQINFSIFESFQFVVRDIIATSLRMGVPIRGAVSSPSF